MINLFNRIRPIQFSFLLAAVIGLVLFNLACESPRAASGTHPANAESLHRIIESGELRVGLTGKLARALANAMRVELVLVETPFAKLLTHLEKGKLDLVISSMTITPTRNARVAFAGPYMISGLSLLTRSDLVEQLSDVASLNSADRSWGALEGSTGEELIADVFPRCWRVGLRWRHLPVCRRRRERFDQATL